LPSPRPPARPDGQRRNLRGGPRRRWAEGAVLRLVGSPHEDSLPPRDVALPPYAPPWERRAWQPRERQQARSAPVTMLPPQEPATLPARGLQEPAHPQEPAQPREPAREQRCSRQRRGAPATGVLQRPAGSIAEHAPQLPPEERRRERRVVGEPQSRASQPRSREAPARSLANLGEKSSLQPRWRLSTRRPEQVVAGSRATHPER